MDEWNPNLKRIIWRNMKKDFTPPAESEGLFREINDSFNNYDQEYRLLNRIMDLSSDELFAANTELRKRNEELDLFVYSTSHDLRAPLTSIMGLLTLIDLTNDENKKRQYLDYLKTSASQLDAFIQDIVIYTHNKKTDTIAELVDLEHLVNDCVAKLSFLNHSDNISKQISINMDAPFFSDKIRLDNIIANLISNAIKYYNPKSKNPFVKLSANSKNEGIEIIIEDNGIGIENEYQPHIFEMFYRASEQSKGSGIGLYIVKEIVEKMKGKISFESHFGKGTTFKLYIPSMKPNLHE